MIKTSSIFAYHRIPAPRHSRLLGHPKYAHFGRFKSTGALQHRFDGRQVELRLWDTTDSEEYAPLVPLDT
jgi:hypothetical protein